MPPFPSLIFAEYHDDPITTKIITALFPHLKSLGYDTYIEELSKNTCVEIIDLVKNALDENEKFSTPDDQFNLPFELIRQGFSMKGGDHQGSRDNLEFIINSCKALRLPSHFIDALVMAALRFFHSTRDESLARTYMENTTPFMARIGLAHLPGIQKYLIQKKSTEVVKDSFLFIHLWSVDNSDRVNNITRSSWLLPYLYSNESILKILEKPLFELAVQPFILNTKNLPLDTVVKLILNRIKEHSESHLKKEDNFSINYQFFSGNNSENDKDNNELEKNDYLIELMSNLSL